MHIGWFYAALAGLTADLVAGLLFLASFRLAAFVALVIAGVLCVSSLLRSVWYVWIR